MHKVFTIAAFAALALGASSCAQDDPTYPFRIIVESEDGTRIQNAHVVASVPLPNTDIRYEGYTGVGGSVSLEHTGGEVVLQVQITKGTDPIIGAGCGYIKLEPDEKVSATIIMEPYDPSDPGCQ